MSNQISQAAMAQHVIESNQPVVGPFHTINAPELGIFKEVAFTTLEFTDDEHKELQELAQQLNAVVQRAKRRLRG